MARITFDQLRLHKAALELRYPNGYRYWDVCGQCILDIAKATDGELDFKELQGGDRCELSFKNHPNASASFGFHNIIISSTCLHNAEFLKKYAPPIISTVKNKLDITLISRLGLRYWFIYEVQDQDAATRQISTMNLFHVAAERFTSFGNRIDISPLLLISNDDMQIRIRIEGAHREKDAGPVVRKEDECFSPPNCVLYDIDFYQENIQGDRLDIALFIQKCYKMAEDGLPRIINPT